MPFIEILKKSYEKGVAPVYKLVYNSKYINQTN